MSEKQLKKDIYDILAEYANRIQRNIEENLAWTTNLKTDVNVIVVEKKETLELWMPDYAVFVQFGRGPGKQPPLNVIYDWCVSKKIDTKWAFPIARKIGKEGLPAHPFMHLMYDELDNMTSDIGDAVMNSMIGDLNKGKLSF